MNTLISKHLSHPCHSYTIPFCACAASPNHQNCQNNIFQRILLRFGSYLMRRFRSDLKRCAQSGIKSCIQFPSDVSALIWQVSSGLIWSIVRQPCQALYLRNPHPTFRSDENVKFSVRYFRTVVPAHEKTI